jgi:non-ribosomal peptide synthetase component F
MNIGGEKPIIEDINTIHRISDALTVNAYGPTEATIVVGYKEIIGAKKYISIGKPFGDNQCFIVNDKNKIINEQYVDGELVLSGSQISRGYINNDEKSKQNFIHSFACHGRAYKTGDISC